MSEMTHTPEETDYARGYRMSIVELQSLRAQLAASEATITALREALEQSERAVASLRLETLGMASNEHCEWSLRDELLTQIRAALASVPPAGKVE